jgi:hypothetical protein
MSDEPVFEDRAPAVAPPPAQALEALVASMKAVRTRVPVRTLVSVAAAALVLPFGALWVLPLRRDLSRLPAAWVVAMAVAWLAGFVAPLALAFLPRPGQVLPDSARAGRMAITAVLVLMVAALLLTADVPGRTIIPGSTWAEFSLRWWHCVSFSLKILVPLVVLGSVALRRAAVLGAGKLGAAVGAAGGALAGLTLHFICPYGGGLHVGLAHGGSVLIGACLGALLLPRVAALASGA